MSRTDITAELETSMKYGMQVVEDAQHFLLNAVLSIMRGQHEHWETSLFVEQSSQTSLGFVALYIESVLLH